MKKIQLKPGAKKHLLRREYTIYSKWIKTDSSVSLGEFVEVVYNNDVIGYGFYDRIGAIGIRIIAYVSEDPPNHLPEIIEWRLKKAFEFRKKMGERNEEGYRLIYADSDGMPGLIIDVYNDTSVVQSTSYGWDRNIEIIGEKISGLGITERVFLKNDQRSRKNFGMKIEKKFVIGGGNEWTIIKEGKARFLVDFSIGQKTGFYLDQKQARLRISKMSLNGKKVLDLFSYTGAFSVHALLAGAKDVFLVDESETALGIARKNMKLNSISMERVSFIRGRVEKIMDNLIAKRRKFDVIIADPPAFIPSPEYYEKGRKAYLKLYNNVFKLLDGEGIVYASSCSFHLTREDLLEIIYDSAENNGFSLRLIFENSPVNAMPFTRGIDEELRYLKGFLVYAY